MSYRESDKTFTDSPRLAQTTYYVCLVMPLTQGQASKKEQNAIKRYTRFFGVKSWLHTFIILSYAQSVKSGLNIAALWRERSNALRYEIAKYAGWDAASNVSIMATHDFKTVMLDYAAQLAEQYFVIEQPIEPDRTDLLFFVLPEDAILPGALCSSRANSISRSSPDLGVDGVPNYVISLTGLCITSGPLAALGIIIAGPLGCSIALLMNVIFWMVLHRIFGWGILPKGISRTSS